MSSRSSSFLNELPYDQLDWMDASSSSLNMQQEGLLLEGDIAETSLPVKTQSAGGGGGSNASRLQSMDTLDEPISETLLRDFRGITSKMRHILLPTSSASAYKSVLKDWDLWGVLVGSFFYFAALQIIDTFRS